MYCMDLEETQWQVIKETTKTIMATNANNDQPIAKDRYRKKEV